MSTELLKKIDTDGPTKLKRGSGRPKSARNRQNIQRVSKLICSQDDNRHSHKSPHEIEKETGISRSTVRRIVKQDLQRRKFTTIEQLKLAIIEEWRKLSKRFIGRSINEWHKRLNKVVENQGGHIEHDY